MANLGGIFDLVGRTNQFTNRQALQQYEQNIPGYAANSAQSAANTADLLGGRAPSTVLNLLGRTAAERAIGTGGGPNMNAAFLGALGLTGLDMNQMGEQNLTAEVGRAPRPELMNAGAFFQSPGDIQAARVGAANVSAAPIPSAAAAAAEAAALRGLRLTGGGGGGVSTLAPWSQGTNWSQGGTLTSPGTILGNANPPRELTHGIDSGQNWGTTTWTRPGAAGGGLGTGPFQNEDEALNWLGWDLPGNISGAGSGSEWA